MIQLEDFYWHEPSGKRLEDRLSIKLEYVYSPTFQLWVKDPSTEMQRCPVLCIKCYHAISPGGITTDMYVAEYLSERNTIEIYWIQRSTEALHIHGIGYGELSRDKKP